MNETCDRQFDGISFSNLHELRKSNPFKVIVGHININSIRNKFEPLKKMIQDNIDILLVSKTKLDDAFPKGQFYIDGYATPYHFDRTSHSGGILLYIREIFPLKFSNLNQCKIISKISLLKSTCGRKSGFFLAHITQLEKIL